MEQIEKARRFAALHRGEAPLVLYNAWDTGSARAVAAAGAEAIATSSWAVAAAHGYEDGQAIPLALVEQIVGRIAASLDLPLTVDFEAGYAEDDDLLAANVARLLALGVVGINFEDRITAGTGLYEPRRQAGRIAALRRAADAMGIPLFINARTDLFLGGEDEPAALLDAAKDRAETYRDAGADGFFVPGLVDDELIGALCTACPLPVNVMVAEGGSLLARLAGLGVARISFGPAPFLAAMHALEATARAACGRLGKA
ncbi:MAG: isocitrate lyase/phosphoenolpyruvate mutase family protein [Sphingomonas sp.]|uniref:isocitrate lyase/PEP mutase family protein n=1 Tax=Sphingomonas sp. TaxID=28214 RepID=UPI001B197A22|nr:isocitrate lyase/phosphoenolpyruvate mutase family protein [Sphingomonas sp.]MBO9621564.1 isocitrate lyase/phosphoenolpyruvate mutase family protein [Sphingomonas sp.]